MGSQWRPRELATGWSILEVAIYIHTYICGVSFGGGGDNGKIGEDWCSQGASCKLHGVFPH